MVLPYRSPITNESCFAPHPWQQVVLWVICSSAIVIVTSHCYFNLQVKSQYHFGIFPACFPYGLLISFHCGQRAGIICFLFSKLGKEYFIAQNVVSFGKCSLWAWICMLLLLDGVVYRYQLCLLDWLCCYVQPCPHWFHAIWCVCFLSKGYKVSNYKNGLIFPLAVVSFFHYVVWCSVVRYIIKDCYVFL